ncbi:MAG: bifunctional UDP-N-acetylglucosamine diphosphorylase/glucosamine-1-phosphate N-acetyltransferase GlmU [Oscillospiraceae bacterium]|nr:bifunctional UDP-N-acetylglucosamine diphosphorylase/glucosamine-1-phosphate N-acetyltransferase GlmU [Oscillospiraceae bacterium]
MGIPNANCVILAAGEGKRMFSRSSKVLCEVTHKPMISWVIDAARGAEIENICVVVGNKDVEDAAVGCSISYQQQRLGTGHAVMCASDFLKLHTGEDTLILYGDTPFMDSDTIIQSYALHKQEAAVATIISARLEDPTGYGRIVRRSGRIAAIVEQTDTDDATAKINEINSGAGWFSTATLLETLAKIGNDNAQGEYYLTDVVSILIENNLNVSVYTAENPQVTLGANSPLDLLNLNDIACQRAILKHLQNGVHFTSRYGIIIGPDVEIAPGAEIMMGSILYGNTAIGKGSIIGPNTIIRNSSVGEDTRLNACQVYESKIGSNVKAGPFSHFRPDSCISDWVSIGDFVEIKNSNIGEGTDVAHLTYIGDSDVGRFCNFGCGTVTSNYDGENKYRTVIKDYAFIGCNTNLIPPVTVGERAYTAAGTTITQDVPDGALAIDRGELGLKEGWADRKLAAYVEKKNRLMNDRKQ